MREVWLELQSSWHLGAVRELRLPCVECPRCGLWAGATACPIADLAPLADLDLDKFTIPNGRQLEVASPSRIVTPAQLAKIVRAIEMRIPEVAGCLSAGASLGRVYEASRTPKPPQIKPVQFVGLFEGVMLAEVPADRLLASGSLVDAAMLPVTLRPDRGATSYRELKFPFAGRSPSWLWSEEERPCSECNRHRHKWRGVDASSIPEGCTHFNVADFTTKFIVREDLAAVLADVAGPTLSFVPVALHRE